MFLSRTIISCNIDAVQAPVNPFVAAAVAVVAGGVIGKRAVITAVLYWHVNRFLYK